jgi:hypothetical protein
MSNKQNKSEITTPTNTVLQTAPAGDDFAADAGVGFEGLDRDDMAIPFIAILQSGSPQCKRSEGAYVEGAAEGMLFNTVTGTVIDTQKTPLIVVPCAYTRSFIEWRLRENGGGFVREHKPEPGLMETTMLDDKNRSILPNGNQLNDTRTFYVMTLDADGTPTPAVLTMTSTQIKKGKQWLMQQNLLKLKKSDGTLITPAMFASKWHVTTVPESNDKGSWMGWKFEHAGYLGGNADPVYVAAKEFKNSIMSGAVKADMSKAPDAAGQPAPNGEPPDRQPGEDDDIEY